jgi:hypothetical protein
MDAGMDGMCEPATFQLANPCDVIRKARVGGGMLTRRSFILKRNRKLFEMCNGSGSCSQTLLALPRAVVHVQLLHAERTVCGCPPTPPPACATRMSLAVRGASVM